jgi:acetyltransferase-like isoleucine patch superfamily enzyme
MNSFLSIKEVAKLGLTHVGKNPQISRHARIYSKDIIIGDNCRIDDFCIMSGKIELGNHVHVAAFASLYGKNQIILKDFCGISNGAKIYSESDDFSGKSLTGPTIPDIFKPYMVKGRVILDKHAVVGAGTIVLPNVRLGEGAIVGAHSLVLKDCEPWKIYAGSPAQFLKFRDKTLLGLEMQLNLTT